jgi:hypothetical protein
MKRTSRRIAARVAVSAVGATVLLASSASLAFAHGQTVTPRGLGGEEVVTGPISKNWAQAHCNAASPAIVTEASGGVMVFTPDEALPCPSVENPGGQVHP